MPTNPVRILAPAVPRVESGPTQFGEDWPGVFIRGDNAGWMAMRMKLMLDDMRARPDLTAEFATGLDAVREFIGHTKGAILGPAGEML
ncbi:MAG TPA: hypothetical protein VD866_29950 [Urbifossiella sp.]|nr:hypothetical protein [Urbifossiella sp.]